MSTKPILFNTDMVRAIQNGSKTVTRRAVKPQPYSVIWSAGNKNWCWQFVSESGKVLVDKQPYRPGDILYVRETFLPLLGDYVYRASVSQPDRWKGLWRPSIHMPREAARIFLRVTDMRVERLWDMTDEDFTRDFCFCREAVQAVGRDILARPMWDFTLKPADRALYGWDANPWVWVIEFERISREEATKVENHPTQL